MREIVKILARLDQGDLEVFLEQLLTPTEKKLVVRRWELVKLLYQGVPQREIATRLSMSLCNVTRGAKELKREDSVFKKVLERLEED